MAPKAQALYGSTSADERTPLTDEEEQRFRAWVAANKIKDLDHPDSHYDYRGYWKDVAAKGQNQTEVNATDGQLHFPDTYKQHGHPTFSQESQYSRGAWDGGLWVEGSDVQLKQPRAAVSHPKTPGRLAPMPSHRKATP